MMKTKTLILLAFLIVAAIGASAKPPKGALPIEGEIAEGQIAVKVGQSATTKDGLEITFLSVDEDSRCPIGVNCIWAGNAKISIEVGKKGAKSQTISLQTQPQAEPETYLNSKIQLIGLTPHPEDGVAINKDDYVATLEISATDKAPAKGFSEPANLPLELRVIAKQATYALDFGGKTEEEYTAQIKPKKTDDKPQLRAPKLPPAPKVDLELELKNIGKETIQVWIGGDATRLDLALQGPGAISVDAQLMFTMEFRMPKAISLEPGKTHTMPIKELSYGMRGVEKRAFWTKPGEYTLAATFSTAISPAPEGTQKTGDDEKFGIVKITSAPLWLFVYAEGTDPKIIKNGGQILFLPEKWYQDQPGVQQTFTGVLQAIPQNDMATTLMRTSLYKLGERTVYTGGKTYPLLDALVGKRVKITGKAVDMELEGQVLKEIWPGMIQPVSFIKTLQIVPFPEPF